MGAAAAAAAAAAAVVVVVVVVVVFYYILIYMTHIGLLTCLSSLTPRFTSVVLAHASSPTRWLLLNVSVALTPPPPLPCPHPPPHFAKIRFVCLMSYYCFGALV